MRSLFDTPLETVVDHWWARIDGASKKALFATLIVSVLAFGFEMTNLTLHHDDVIHFFIEDTILGHYLGRPGFGWLHFYTQNHYVMPFLQLAEGLLLTAIYGVIVARFWGVTKATDIALVASIMCVFPYMAHVYQYNTSMAPFPAAHLLAALAVICSVRGRVGYIAASALLYVGAFSIYQAVAANAATILAIWFVARLVFDEKDPNAAPSRLLKSGGSALISVIIGGAIYLWMVSAMHLAPDTIHSSEEAFHLHDALDFTHSLPEVWNDTRSFFRWPENYFPDYLKELQLALIGAGALVCWWVPGRLWRKLAAAGLLVVALFAPRALQLLHWKGHFHSLTLTAYAVLIGGAVMLVNRAARGVVRNASIIVASVLIAGYVLQCNWVSTVNYLNTLSHLETMTQVLAELRSIPGARWDGKKVAVVGRYDPASDYPFRPSAGVATNFADGTHLAYLARLMRDEANFVPADETMPEVLEYAATHPIWPEPGSVGIVDGMGVVVFAHTQTAPAEGATPGLR